ncbi:oligosaccharide flippase family protein [Pedobacter alpinus]|uniref:Oligosaccharide flippase family protein n=1 Tax=Pedobacter alpinus TaxID=1590643 RepID=A0ABW5TWJ8_9SPHI
MTNKKGLLQNSMWGLASNILQNILLSVFFIIIARELSEQDFANYLIANSLYLVISSVSALGLGQWFIRQLNDEEDVSHFLNKFLKIQLLAGLFFYLINVAVAFTLYQDKTIQILSILIGVNIVFDNVIYGVKHLNIAQFEQNKTFVVLIVEAAIKLLLAVVIYLYPYTVIEMAVVLVIIRVVTLNLFLRISTSKLANLASIIKNKISFTDFKKLIIANWPFIIVGSIAIIYWRIGSILISKFLPVRDVATYEIGYKFFSLTQIIPVIVSASIFPELLRAHKEGGKEAFNNLYKLFYKIYLVFGFLAFSFMYSFADDVILLAFGEKFADAGFYTKEMFLTILVFPTALLQANVLIILKMERKDMWFNIASFVLNFSLAFIGLMYFKSLSVINLSIFISFIVFHLLQDTVMVKEKITKPLHIIGSYLILFMAWFAYAYLSDMVNQYLLFIGFWIIGFTVFIYTDKRILGFIKEKAGFK